MSREKWWPILCSVKSEAQWRCSAQTKMHARITSYNVCYTKLLRYADCQEYLDAFEPYTTQKALYQAQQSEGEEGAA